jgi:hypothetical protein
MWMYSEKHRGTKSGVGALPLALTIAFLSFATDTAQAEGKALSDEKSPTVGAPLAVQERRMELSGCAVVEGGVLVVEDELIGAVLLLEQAKPPLVLSTVKLERKKKARAPYADAFKLFPFQDFEDIASDGMETVYFIGSHHGKEGERRPDREFLFKGEWDAKGKELKVVGEQYGLLERIAPVLEGLGSGIGLTKTDVSDGLNIEGLALHGETLFIGLRSPLTPSGMAILLSGPVAGVMDGSAALESAELDLGGGGVRALDWDPVRDELLVLSGAPGSKSAGSALYALNPSSGALSPIVRFDDEIARKSPEGICRLPQEAGGKLLLVLDGEGGEAGAEFVEIDG